MGLREVLARWLNGEDAAPYEAQREAAPRPAAPAPPAPQPVRDERVDVLASQRRKLVVTCIALVDQVGSEMLEDRIADALEEVGVRAYRPDGERFDPSRHRASGNVPAETPEQDGVVAITQRPGYRDGDELVRVPEVLVWRAEGRA